MCFEMLGDCALAAELANAISKATTTCKPEIHLLERVRICDLPSLPFLRIRGNQNQAGKRHEVEAAGISARASDASMSRTCLYASLTMRRPRLFTVFVRRVMSKVGG